MTDDPELAMNLRCFAEGLKANIDRLAAHVAAEGGASEISH